MPASVVLLCTCWGSEVGDQKWRLTQEVRKWWVGLHVTLFSLCPTGLPWFLLPWWDSPESVSGGVLRNWNPITYPVSPPPLINKEVSEWIPSSRLFVNYSRGSSLLSLNSRPLSFILEPSVGRSHSCDRLLECPVQAGSFSTICSADLTCSFSPFQLYSHWLGGSQMNERWELDGSDDSCL